MKAIFILFLMSFTNPEPNVVELPIDQAAKYVGRNASVCGKVAEVRVMGTTNKYILLCMGATYPNQSFSIKIDIDDLKGFTYKPEQFLKNKSVCVTGKILENNGKTEMIIEKQEDIKVNDEGNFEIRANDLDAFNKYFKEKE